jgi:hypothetical protein
VLELIRGARFDDFSRNSILGESLGSVWCCNTGCVKLRHTKHKPDIAEYHSSEYRSSDYPLREFRGGYGMVSLRATLHYTGRS